MKILLIKEPSNVLRFPPMGLLYLAAAIRSHRRHDVRIIDAVAEQLTLEEIGEKAACFQPDIIGITVYTSTLYDSVRLSQKIREVVPETIIVWGGPHLTWFPEESINLPFVDYVIQGEAEDSFVLFCDALEDRHNVDHVSGLVYKDGDAIRHIGRPGYVKDLDSLPFPAFELLDFEKYQGILGVKRPLATIGMSRGCPFQCTFCAKTDSFYRSRSVNNVLEEMSNYIEHGIREFFFFDDLFNLTSQKVKDFASAILNQGWNDIFWSFRGRVDAVDEEMLQLTRKAGCRCIFYGIEAATNEGLRAIKKRITIEQARDTVRMTRQASIMTGTNWIIGLPNQTTREEVLRVCDTALEMGSESVQFSILRAYHGTEIFRQGVELGIFEPDLWKEFARNPRPDFAEPVWQQYFSRQELEDLLKVCYRKLYKTHYANMVLRKTQPILTKAFYAA